MSRRTLRRGITAAAIALTASGTMAVSAPAAQAAPLTPMERCQLGYSPNINYQMTQYGNATGINYPAGPNPPNGIYPGDVIKVVIDPAATVAIDYWGTRFGVDGHNSPAPSSFPFPGWPRFSALYRFNNNPGGWVASGNDPNPYNPHALRELTVCTHAPNIPVRLGVGINDDNLGDNSGYWRYWLKLWY
ncbi:hypothetical protein ACFQV2_20655 [Actinokineospora soli]|uniref:Secreted protein n=1 Tax=Actinokineospora soli TaxID=1048753 RepID=A0ABW2TP31_9PSEU